MWAVASERFSLEKYGNFGCFSGRIGPDKGNIVRADTAGLGSIC